MIASSARSRAESSRGKAYLFLDENLVVRTRYSGRNDNVRESTREAVTSKSKFRIFSTKLKIISRGVGRSEAVSKKEEEGNQFQIEIPEEKTREN